MHDLKISEEIASGRDTLSGYSMYDVIMIGQGDVAMIVKVSNDGFKVLLQNSSVKNIVLSDIRNKIGAKTVGAALDKNKNSVRVNDVIRVIAGEHAGLEGTVKHIHRSLLFIHSRQRLQNAGLFVERARNSQLSGETVKRGDQGFGIQGN